MQQKRGKVHRGKQSWGLNTIGIRYLVAKMVRNTCTPCMQSFHNLTSLTAAYSTFCQWCTLIWKLVVNYCRPFKYILGDQKKVSCGCWMFLPTCKSSSIFCLNWLIWQRDGVSFNWTALHVHVSLAPVSEWRLLDTYFINERGLVQHFH